MLRSGSSSELSLGIVGIPYLRARTTSYVLLSRCSMLIPEETVMICDDDDLFQPISLMGKLDDLLLQGACRSFCKPKNRFNRENITQPPLPNSRSMCSPSECIETSVSVGAMSASTRLTRFGLLIHATCWPSECEPSSAPRETSTPFTISNSRQCAQWLS